VASANDEALNRVVPLEREVEYYRLLQGMLAGPAAREMAADEAVRRYREILAAVRLASTQTSQLYGLLSENLNSRKSVVSVTGPVQTVTSRSADLGRLLLYSILCVLLTFPLIVAACFLHARHAREADVVEVAG
jgi:hypothetical protein